MYTIPKRVGGYLRHHNGTWHFDFNTYPLNSKLKEAFIAGPVLMIDMKETHTDDAEYNYSSHNAKHTIQNSGHLDTKKVVKNVRLVNSFCTEFPCFKFALWCILFIIVITNDLDETFYFRMATWCLLSEII